MTQTLSFSSFIRCTTIISRSCSDFCIHTIRCALTGNDIWPFSRCCTSNVKWPHHKPRGVQRVKVRGLTNTALPPWHFVPPTPPPSPPAWLKNYCIWCNLMDCWTVNMLQPQTAVLPRVKCDGWAGEQGGHMEMTEHERKRNSVRLCFINPLTTHRHWVAFIPLSLFQPCQDFYFT